MGLLQQFWTKILELFTEEITPHILFLSTSEEWVKKQIKHVSKPEEEKIKISDDTKQLLEEINAFYLERTHVIDSISTNKTRLQLLSQQKDDKEVNLLRAKDSDEYRELVPLLEKEKETHNSCEELDDALFLSLVRLKATLSELQDFNSNYELLDVIKTVNTIQENFSYFFQDNYYSALLEQLRGVRDKLVVGSLIEKEDLEFPFHILFDQFTSGNFADQREDRIRMNETLSNLARSRLQNNLFTKIEDLKYRLDHFVDQEKQLREHLETQEKSLGEVTDLLTKRRLVFEQYVLRHLKKEVVLDLGSLEIFKEKTQFFLE